MRSNHNEPLNVDGVLAISIKDREDRRRNLIQQFEKTGLEIEFLLVDRDSEDPQRGCFLSHQKCAEIAIARNYNFTLILEDDATLLQWSSKLVRKINIFLKNNSPELLFFGLMLGKLWPTTTWGIARGSASGAHCYIMSKSAALRVAGLSYEGKNMDSIFRKQFVQHCLFPMISEQALSTALPSDIETKRRELRGLHNEVTENYDWHKNRRKQWIEFFKNFYKVFKKIFNYHS